MGQIEVARKTRKAKAKPERIVHYVAMEGSVTERKYFDALIREYNLRNVILLRKAKTRSSPSDVIKRLERQIGKKTNDHGEKLEEHYWAVFDTDRRSISTLRNAAERASKKKIGIAASNPCFELWLLLHFGSLADMKGLEGSAAAGGCKNVTDYLRRRFDRSYEKSSFDPSKYVDRIAEAIKNADASDTQGKDAWMDSVGSRVYKLVERVLESADFSPSNT
ncbi:MAG: RloB family protein [Chloroflexi bacterium]|nr:RloB family protein [Chloroflexota bacterium]